MGDPRDYLYILMKQQTQLLSENHRTTDDFQFLEVIDLVREQVATQVENLCHIFGCVGLATRVDRSMTLERRANLYSS